MEYGEDIRYNLVIYLTYFGEIDPAKMIINPEKAKAEKEKEDNEAAEKVATPASGN